MPDLKSILNNESSAYLRDLETLVNIDCGTHSKAGVDRVSAYLRERFRDSGAAVQEFPQEQYGDMFYARWTARGKARIFLIGHLDTVYLDGSAAEHPFRKRGNFAHGCGVIDMKSGVLNALYAVRALRQSGFENLAEIGMFCNTEEEIGSPVSSRLYPQFVRGAAAALVLEPARANGAVVSARKGVGTYVVTVRGKSAHAGVEPEKGANAIVALAQMIAQVKELNGLREGLTVNVGTIRGGIARNVVPDFAEVGLDVRVVRAADAAPLEHALREIVAREFGPGTHAELRGEISKPPMERNAATEELLALARDAARQVGFELHDVATGGGSDGNYTAALGVPTLDGLGPIGGKAHNAAEEYLELDSFVPRAAMLAGLIRRIADG